MKGFPRGATEQFGVQFHDGSVMCPWNGRTARRNAEAEAQYLREWVAERTGGRGIPPLDTFTVVVRNSVDDPWRPVHPPDDVGDLQP